MANTTLNEIEITTPHKDWTADLFQPLSEICDQETRQMLGKPEITFRPIYGYTISIRFSTRSPPPIEEYQKIEEIKNGLPNETNVIVWATWLDEADNYDKLYRWMFDGKNYEVIKTNLTYCNLDSVEGFHNDTTRLAQLVEEQIGKLQTRRANLLEQLNGLDQAIKALRTDVLDDLSEEVPF